MEAFGCRSGQQTDYVSLAIANSSMQYFSRSISSRQYEVTLNGTLNSSGKFTAKTVDVTDKSVSSTTSVGKSALVQGPLSATIDTFNVYTYNRGTETNRLYSSFDLGYAGSESLVDPRQYQLGSGAGRLIFTDVTSAVTDQTECWNGDTLKVDSGSCGSHLSAVEGKTPRSVEDVSISDFTGSQAVNCSTLSSEFSATMDTSSSGCARFEFTSEEIDCYVSALGGSY